MIVWTCLAKLRTMLAVIRVQQTDCWKCSTKQRRETMWTKPEATEMRFGFEVTMYVCNR
jgi:pyrroloquinoline quinone biosynthesis protein A